MEEYLLGVEAEPLRAEDALVHYGNVLRERPESFWGHYRAAAVAYRLHDPAAAADHLEYCICRRPENPVLRGQLAGCLYDLNRFDAALEQCNKALTLNPDHAESYRTRAFIRSTAGPGGGPQDRHRAVRIADASPGQGPRMATPPGLDVSLSGPTVQDRSILIWPAATCLSAYLPPIPRTSTCGPPWPRNFWKWASPDAALAEFDKVLEINPDHLRARYFRGGLLYRSHPSEAEIDLSYLLEHPRFEELLRESDKFLHAFYYDTWALLQKGAVDQALQVAQRGLSLAYQLKSKEMQAELHYALARVYAVAAKSDPKQFQQAVENLGIAFRHHDKYREQWFPDDPFFEGRRKEIELLVPKTPR